MNATTDNMIVHITYRDVQQTFSGKPEDVWISVGKFFTCFLPSFEMARKLTLCVDLQTLISQCEGLIAFSAEGPNLLVERDKLTDHETISLLLLAAHIGSKLEKSEKDTMSKSALQTKLGKNVKITSTRLGEMIKAEMIIKMDDDEYKITTFGLLQMQKDILPRIKTRIRA